MIIVFLPLLYSETAIQENVYYDGAMATSYPSGSAGAIVSSTPLLVASEADSATTQQVR